MIVSAQGRSPSIIISITHANVRKRYQVALIQIVEENLDMVSVRSIDLSRIVFYFEYNFGTTFQKWIFSANISGYGNIVVYPEG